MKLRWKPTRLPSGTLTFVHTDMEGSTSLLRSLGHPDYPTLREDHHRLMQSAFAARGGVRVDSGDDSSLTVFAGATQALAASLDAQLALLDQQWPRGAQVRVRMGLHTGEARPVGRCYAALAVHEAARIKEAAHGGQVLVSEITRQLVADDLPGDVELADLGEYCFKDFEVPQHIFQLCHPRLPTEFPPIVPQRQCIDPCPSRELQSPATWTSAETSPADSNLQEVTIILFSKYSWPAGSISEVQSIDTR